MRITLFALSIAALNVIGIGQERAPLHVLDIGEANKKERTAAFNDFLVPRFETVTLTTHEQFKRDLADRHDVVILDWHQGGTAPGVKPTSPLGPREGWNRPTVLIGSAGLNLAMAWEVYEDHARFLVLSENGGYRWYVDGWAKRRGMPAAGFRGPARRDPRKTGK